MNNTLSKETSQKIKELGISLETEKWWVWIDKPNPQVVHNLITLSERYNKILDTDQKFPAPSFSELLLALKEIGEKLGIIKHHPAVNLENHNCNAVCKNPPIEIAHRLTDIFLESGMEGVDKYISELIKS